MRKVLEVLTAGVLCVAVTATTMWTKSAGADRRAKSPYRSPFAVVASPDGSKLYVSDRTAGRVVVLDTATSKPLREIGLKGEPAGLLLSPDGGRLYVAEYGAASVAVIDTAKGKVEKEARVGLRPVGLALAPKAGKLFVCNTDVPVVSVIDVSTMKNTGRVPVVRQPMFAAVTPDETKVVVGNALPLGLGTDPTLAAEVSIVDVATLQVLKNVKLPAGGTNVRGIAVSPDSKWAYLVHGVARFNIPPTQLERGWVNTHALSVLDLAKGELYATVLLDFLAEGGADPFGVALSADGSRLWVSLGGTRQVAVVEAAKLVEMCGGKVPAELITPPDASSQNLWYDIAKDPSARNGLVDDLAAMYQANLLSRLPSGGNGPRGLCLSPDGKTVYVANYYSGNVVGMDVASGKQTCDIAIGSQPEPDEVRKGEMVFHDALTCFQHWQSCATCHPDQARVDALDWDLLNDDMGNPKNNKSLLFVDRTAPMMSRAIREDMDAAVRAGFKFILFCVPEESDVAAVEAYLKSLRPEPSPYLAPNGKLTPAAERGRKLFEGKADCARCHPKPLFTDLKPYDVGTRGDDTDPQDAVYDTPTLIEVYRTAPYLHDGSALTLNEVLTTRNKNDKHGKTSGLSAAEVDDLVAYLLSL